MPVFTPNIGLPGYSAERIANHRHIAADGYLQFLPGGLTLDGAKTRDVGNTDYNASTNPYAMHRLQAGVMLGKVTSSGKYANSFLGYSNGALTGAGTELTLASTRHARELVRRIGATGTFKLIGPPTAAGTVRERTVTYSAVDTTTGVVTITAVGVADVWTLTAPAGQDGGMYQLRVTTGKGTSAEASATTAALAANANTATVDAALEALANVGAGGVAAVYADPTLTLTFASNLGPVEVEVVSDTTNDGGVFEGGWAAVHTTTGVDGRFVTGSLIADTDGSHLPLTFIPDGWQQNIPEDSTDVYLAQPPIGGNIDMSRLLPYWPADASLKQWCRDYLNSYGKFVDTSKY